MAYTPRKRSYRIRWKFAAPLLLLVSLCVYGIVSVLMQPEEVDERYAICNYTPDQTLKN